MFWPSPFLRPQYPIARGAVKSQRIFFTRLCPNASALVWTNLYSHLIELSSQEKLFAPAETECWNCVAVKGFLLLFDRFCVPCVPTDTGAVRSQGRNITPYSVWKHETVEGIPDWGGLLLHASCPAIWCIKLGFSLAYVKWSACGKPFWKVMYLRWSTLCLMYTKQCHTFCIQRPA